MISHKHPYQVPIQVFQFHPFIVVVVIIVVVVVIMIVVDMSSY